MFSSDAFDLINVLDKTADASWLREEIISNNVANADTPNYKRQDIEFSSILKSKLNSSGASNLKQALNNIDMSSLEGEQYTDYAGYSYRLDENNVDIDTENVELASESIRYQALTAAMKQEFNMFDTVTKS